MTTRQAGLATVVAVVLAAGCTRWSMAEKFQRTEEMVDHQIDMVGARDAIRADDLDKAKGYARSLARPDWFPGLGPEAKEGLAAVRSEAEKLAAAENLDAAAQQLTALTAQCAACHRSQGIPAPATWTGDADESLWIGVVWESQERWAEGAKDHKELAEAADWAARRAGLAATL